jgi:hypothetical protein
LEEAIDLLRDRQIFDMTWNVTGTVNKIQSLEEELAASS